MPVYEVWCHSCNVTFPPEAHRCVHCGGRLRPEPPPRSGRRREPEASWVGPVRFGEPIQRVPESMPGTRGIPGTTIAGGPTGPLGQEEDEEPVRRSLLRAGMTVLWMVLLAAGYAWRACSQQQ